MSGRVLTEVSATVDPQRADELVAAFEGLAAAPLPDGLLRTELVRGPEDDWRIQTLWRDRAALDAMIALGETPTARRLFEGVGAASTLRVLSVAADLHAPAPG